MTVEQYDMTGNGDGYVTETPGPLPQAGALHDAIFRSANVSCIATDALGVIQALYLGAEHMPGYQADTVIHRIALPHLGNTKNHSACSRAKYGISN